MANELSDFRPAPAAGAAAPFPESLARLRLKARIAGLLYAGTIVTGVFGIFARSTVIVRGDAAATAGHLTASEALFRAGFAADLVGTACYVGVAAILYELLAPVSRTVSRLAAFFAVGGCAIGALNSVNLLAAVILLSGAPYLDAFSPPQLQALAMAALKVHSQGYNIGMVNFGLYCTLLGCLILRSRLFPSLLGGLLILAGLGWLADSFIGFLWPPLSSRLYPYIMAPGFVGEASLMVWLLAVGVKAERWPQEPTRRPS